MLCFYHNTRNDFYRKPFGAVACGTEVTIRTKVLNKDDIESLVIVFYSDNETKEYKMLIENNIGDECIYKYVWKSPVQPLIFWYYFKFIYKKQTFYYGDSLVNLEGDGNLSDRLPKGFQITVYNQDFSPAWFKQGIMYQIFVDRFYKGISKKINRDKKIFLKRKWNESPSYIKDNKGRVIKFDYFGGDIVGIIEKIPYLKDLGVTILYLNPIFEAFSNHKYDTANYKKIDPMFGSNKIFRILCAKAKENGISIILDGVFNHTGSDSVYFNKKARYKTDGAYQSKQSQFYNWYNFYNYPEKYECWWGIDSMPRVNCNNEVYREYIIEAEDSVINRWMGYGVKGFRLDVADELTDDFIYDFKKQIKKNDKESILIGEVWEDASNKISYSKRRKYFSGNELDSVMNYPLRDALINFAMGLYSGERLNDALMRLYENYPKENFYAAMNFLGSHDTERILTILGEAPDKNSISDIDKKNYKLSKDKKIKAIKRLKMLSMFIMAFPGTPCVYYGDEIGIEGYEDPYNRTTYPWGNEDNEIKEWYKKVISIRKSKDSIKSGEWNSIYTHANVYGFMRYTKSQEMDCYKEITVFVFNNDSINEHTISIDLRKYEIKKVYNLLNNRFYELISGRLVITINALESISLEIK